MCCKIYLWRSPGSRFEILLRCRVYPMNCDEYVGQFLSAHADDELTVTERLLVEKHLHDCPSCRARLVEEHALKAHVRRQAGILRTPADVRLRIRASLGERVERDREYPNLRRSAPSVFRRNVARRPAPSGSLAQSGVSKHSSGDASTRSGSARKWLALQLRRAQQLAPIGFVVIVLAGATMLFRSNWRSMSGLAAPKDQRSIPTFDFAIDRLDQLSREFAPNVPPEAFSRDDGAYFAWVEGNDPVRHVSAELPDISASYEKMQMLPEFCDFALAGYQLVGGRIDRMPNGEPVTYTLYRNQANSLLSIGLKKKIGAPQGGYWFGTHALYSYRNYSLCLTIDPVGHFVSIIVARAPMVQLLRDVAASDIVAWDR
ncbi:MAG: zf-HC2 domain-containing protein [Deltaproteobacteria bacterium]|nr:zf-HC2 domain-containing protein [Deltaproteobacteria bacterium]